MEFMMGRVSHSFVPLNFTSGIVFHRGRRIIAARFGSMLGRLIAMILISAPAGAANFRGLEFGAPCAAAPAHEQARGSVAIPWKTNPGADVYAFTGREYNRDLVIIYACPQGTLVSGNYMFPVEQLEKTVSTYRDVHDRLVSIYGAPFIDSPPWQVGTKDPRGISQHPQKYITSWRTPILNVAMSILRTNEPPGWRVFVVIDRRLFQAPVGAK
jgi:hypothetical protein